MSTSTDRRQFLNHIAALGMAAMVPQRTARTQSVPTRTIPGTEEALPMVGLGSTKAVLQIPESGLQPIRDVVQRLVDLGGRVVDTSPRTETIDAAFGSVLQQPHLTNSLFLAAKINTTSRQSGIDQFRQTQRLFGRRTLDLVQVESLRGLDIHWPNLQEWKASGEARYVGVTVSSYDGYDRLESFMRRESPDFVHVNYSVAETRAEERILPLAADRGFAVLTNRPFMNGAYFPRVNRLELPPWAADFDCTSWAQFSLKYILSNPAVTVALTETTNPRHMEENFRSAYGRMPDEAMRRRMRDVVRTA